jgi:hypothetical protein
VPLSRRARARAGTNPRFVREPPPAPVRFERAAASGVVEIDWRPAGERVIFEARALTPLAGAPGARSPAFAATGDGPPPRTGETSRAHALLCDRLVLAGWEPCGQGEAWFAHRFRLAPTTRPPRSRAAAAPELDPPTERQT